MAALVACGPTIPPPPERLYVDHRFSDEQMIMIAQAVDMWCAAVVWCPSFVEDPSAADGSVEWSNESTPRQPYGTGGEYSQVMGLNYYQDSRVVILMGNRPPPAVFGPNVLHEFGHFGIYDHPCDAGVMSRNPHRGAIRPPGQCDIDHWGIWSR